MMSAELQAEVVTRMRTTIAQSPIGRARVFVEFEVSRYRELRDRCLSARTRAEALAADALLAQAVHGNADAVLTEIRGTDFAALHVYNTIPFVGLSVSRRALDRLLASPSVKAVYEARDARFSLNSTTQVIGAGNAWAAGYTGAGQSVAILDSGVLTSHQMFAGKTILEACFSSGNEFDPIAGDCPNGLATQFGPGAAAPPPSTFDGFDHGTHVAGIAVGNGSTLDGVARDADLVAIQVFHRRPSDPACCDPPPAICPNPAPSCVLTNPVDYTAALEYVFALRFSGASNIAAVNMSLGGGIWTDQLACDAVNFPTLLAIENLRSLGIATVIAAGNDGSCSGISAPGCISSAVAVGASNDSDQEASFSNDHAMVDLFAPGVAVISAGVTTQTSSNQGTSMAAPHVAGAWAVLRQASPLSVPATFEALRLTGEPVSGRSNPCATSPSQPRIQLDRAALAVQVNSWVDFGYTGILRFGTILEPYTVLSQGVHGVSEGGTLGFKPGSTPETLTITKPMTMRAFGGPVVIGN